MSDTLDARRTARRRATRTHADGATVVDLTAVQRQRRATRLIAHAAERARDEAACRDLEQAYPGRYYLRTTDIADVVARHAGEVVFDGCTEVWLRHEYGPNVRHHHGVGWYLDLTDPAVSAETRATFDRYMLPDGPPAGA